MSSAARSLWAEPRPAHPPQRVWRDWLLVAVLVPTAVIEGLLRQDLPWRGVALVVGVGLMPALLWRRTRPLVVVAVVAGVLSALSVATLILGGEPTGLYTTAWVLLLPYSLFRWGAGREAVVGLGLLVVMAGLGVAADFTGLVDTVVGFAFLLFPAVLGASVRYRATSRIRELDQVRLREREQLARELHDTVAHHVSAIAIQAQAGRTLAASHPDRARQALEVIEEAASRTLAEMRTMVGVLRDGEEPDRAPQRGLADVSRLARTTGEWPRVEVQLSGALDDVTPSVGAAIHRLAQESVTNASRHARHATRITVSVTGADSFVRLTVRDDGHASSGGRRPPGYGLVGMRERAALLGGTLEAGPDGDGGWTVDAVLPKAGAGG